MISVVATIRLHHGQRDSFLEIFKANVPEVLRETGCLEYYPAIDLASGIAVQLLEEDVVTIIEKWQSLEALRAHLATPHMLAYREKVQPLVRETSLKVLQPA